MMDMKKIAVFCSARKEIDPQYNKVAREFVWAASLRGYGIVSGGTVKGTMGEISDELYECGGYHLGVIPHFMEEYLHPHLSEVIWTDTMSERKALLRKDVCAVVALPGGIGTLDELIETMTLVHLKRIDVRMYVLDHNGFYGPFRQLLLHYVQTGMLCRETYEKMVFAETVDEILDDLQG